MRVDDLVSTSALARLREETPTRVARVDFGDAGQPVEAAAIDHVLYLPALHLQIWRGRIVPNEANADDDAFLELQECARNGAVLAHAPFVNIDEIDEDVCVLSNFYSDNFFHFFEELYKVIILERAGFTGRYAFSAFPSRIAQTRPNFSAELLEQLGIGQSRILHLTEPTLLRSAWLTTRIAHADTPRYPGAFFALREALIAAIADRPGLGPRLWLDRRGDRAVVNAPQVNKIVTRHGFTIVEMSELSAAAQIAALQTAQVLGGPHGAAMIHAMFLKERSTVIECFSPNYVNPCILEICRILKHTYYQIVGTTMPLFEYQHGGNVEINLNHLNLVLRNLN